MLFNCLHPEGAVAFLPIGAYSNGSSLATQTTASIASFLLSSISNISSTLHDPLDSRVAPPDPTPASLESSHLDMHSLVHNYSVNGSIIIRCYSFEITFDERPNQELDKEAAGLLLLGGTARGAMLRIRIDIACFMRH